MVDLLSFLLFFLLCFHFGVLESATTGNGIKEIAESKSLFHVGVVLDLNSSVGAMADVCLSMALSDFYARHSIYQTRLLLHTRDSADVVSAGFAVLDLLKKEEVQAIIGPQTSTEATFVIELGGKVHVPIILFSATSLSLSPAKSPYFIRAAQNDSSQLRGITAIVQEFGWHEVVLLYEDTEYYNGIVPYLTDAFQVVDIRVPYKYVIPTSATDFQIVKELNKLMTMQTRVFLVHMTTSLGSRLFELANKAGMMSEGYAWLITDDLSNLLDAMDPMVIESMEGVLGLRPYVPRSRELEYFKRRWKRKFSLMKPNSTATELNIFGLWAYDAVWTLAMAVERIGWANFRSIKVNNSTKNATDLANLGISEIGPRLLNEISNTRLKGISGEFQLVNGQLQRSAFEIFNVMGEKDRTIGYWTPGKGLCRKLAATDTLTSSTTSTSNLKKIIWPGDTTITPKGWAIPTVGKLKIGIPVKQGFKEFAEICRDPHTNKITYKGFSIDVFRAVLEALPFKVQHEFIPFMNDDGKSAGSYDDLLYQIYNKSFDAVVGDMTIIANRTSWVDFALPYSESRVSMLVSIKHDKPRNMWIFIKPLSGDLWLTIIAACIFTGLAIGIMEHRVNTELGSLGYSQRLHMIIWLPFSMLVFPDSERVNNKYSRFVLVIWLCLAYILLQSYTACLSSILTVDQLQPTVASVKELVRKGYYVGYQEDSFVKDLLINQLNFKESKLKPYSSIEEYNEALSKGSHNGGVAAIFDEIPYIKLFLKRYGSTYMMAGPTYRTDGFGFAFPIGSSLVSYVSRAILNVTEGEKMNKLEKMYFGEEDSSQGQAAPSPPDGPILTPYSFAGLFIITGIVIFLALLGSETQNSFWQILVAKARYYLQTFLPPQPSNNIEPRVHSIVEMSGNGDPPEIDNLENPTTVEMSGNGDSPEINHSENATGISNQNDENVPTEEEREVHS